MFQPVDPNTCQVERMLKLSMFMDRLIHVEGSFIQKSEGLDEPEEHLGSWSVNHYILYSVPLCSDSRIQRIAAPITSFERSTLTIPRHHRAGSRPALKQLTAFPT